MNASGMHQVPLAFTDSTSKDFKMAISYSSAAFDTTSGSASATDTAKGEMEKTMGKAMVASYKNQADMSKLSVQQMDTKKNTDLLNSVVENAKAVRL
jgi:hypothetical protein